MANELEKRANFERLAKARTSRAVQRIRMIGTLANRGNYNYSYAHVKQITDALEAEVHALTELFNPTRKTDPTEFDFDGKFADVGACTDPEPHAEPDPAEAAE